MKVLVVNGFAHSTYPDYITEEVLDIDADATLYRVKENEQVLEELPISLLAIPGLDEDISRIDSNNPVSKKAMTEAEIQEISI